MSVENYGGRPHIGTLLICPGCRASNELDATGGALFAVGRFDCRHCGSRWIECPNPDCYGLSPDCPTCPNTGGWMPYVGAALAARGARGG